MKKPVIVAIVMLAGCFQASVSGAETTLRLATPDNPITNPVDDIEITAGEIDQSLGTSFFSTTADDLFSQLAAFRSAVEVDIRDVFLSNPDQIKNINSVEVKTDPISATISQFPSVIMANVTEIDATVSGKADGQDIPIFCTSINFTTDLHFSGMGDFNIATLSLENFEISVLPNVRNASCSGVFGFLGNLFVNLLTGDSVETIFQNKLETRLRNFAGFENLQTMFSLGALTQDLFQAIPSGVVAEKSLPVIGQFLSMAHEDIGVVLKVELRPDFYGPGGHLISLIASQQKPIVHASDIGDVALVQVDSRFPDNHCEMYIDNILWKTGSCGTISSQVPQSSQPRTVRVVEESGVVPGLKSFPGIDILVPVECEPGEVLCAS